MCDQEGSTSCMNSLAVICLAGLSGRYCARSGAMYAPCPVVPQKSGEAPLGGDVNSLWRKGGGRAFIK